MGEPTGLAEEQRRALDRLKALLGTSDFYLAGGSALAFHLHHRRSLDLDLFSTRPDLDLAPILRTLEHGLPDLEVRSTSDVALKVALAGTIIDIVSYPYPPIDTPALGPGGFPVAGIADLAAMKLAAVAHRGIRRDFWDLHEINRSGFALSSAARAFVQRFRKQQGDLYHVVRSLTYFEDAEKDPLFPAGLTTKHWEEIKEFFLAEAPRLLKALTVDEG